MYKCPLIHNKGRKTKTIILLETRQRNHFHLFHSFESDQNLPPLVLFQQLLAHNLLEANKILAEASFQRFSISRIDQYRTIPVLAGAFSSRSLVRRSIKMPTTALLVSTISSFRLLKASTRSISTVSHLYIITGRSFSSDKKPSSPLVGNEWRKQQLDKIENKFKGKELKALKIESEEDLQPMWKEMEGRVTRRKPRTLADTGGKSGRMNIKKTDEDVWLQQGLYETNDSDSSNKKE